MKKRISSQRDVDDIVADAAAVREPGEVAGQHADWVPAGRGRGRDARVQAEHVRRLRVGLPPSGHLTALVAFNLGVEAGQLAVIAVAFLLVGWWSATKD